MPVIPSSHEGKDRRIKSSKWGGLGAGISPSIPLASSIPHLSEHSRRWLAVRLERTPGKAKTKAVSHSQFPVGCIHGHLKSRTTSQGRVQRSRPGVPHRRGTWIGRKCTKRRYLQLAVLGDEDLDSLIKATTAGGGVIPPIYKLLIGKKGQQKTV